jgi:putative transposase
VRESGQSWRELLLDLKRRGLTIAPELAVADGALGFWQAIEEVWPQTRGQRCWVHKTANVLNKLPKSLQPKAKRALQEIWMAETKKNALIAFDAFVETWGVKYDKAVECLIKDRDALLSFYDFPAEHWKHLRTTNVIESSFATVRHRTVRSKGCLSNKTRARHDLQACRGRRKKLASSRRSQPVAESNPRDKVRRRTGGCQIARSSRCRLSPCITKIRR